MSILDAIAKVKAMTYDRLLHCHMERHRDDEYIDEVRIKVVPRYKTSGLSGDEWRIAGHVDFYRKGRLIVEKSYRDMRTAIAALPWLWEVWGESGEYDKLVEPKIDEHLCHQPGCAEPAVVLYRLKRRFSREGDESDPRGAHRAFCARHKTRGDCGLEDADANYEVVYSDETRDRN